MKLWAVQSRYEGLEKIIYSPLRDSGIVQPISNIPNALPQLYIEFYEIYLRTRTNGNHKLSSITTCREILDYLSAQIEVITG
jgi:hypothetical protein